MTLLQVHNEVSHELLTELHFELPGTAGQLKTCIAGCRPDLPLQGPSFGVMLWRNSKEPGHSATEVEDWDEMIDADHSTYTYLFRFRTLFDVWKDMEHDICYRTGSNVLMSEPPRNYRYDYDMLSWSCQ